jgi:hypothetical protein
MVANCGNALTLTPATRPLTPSEHLNLLDLGWEFASHL